MFFIVTHLKRDSLPGNGYQKYFPNHNHAVLVAKHNKTASEIKKTT